MKIRESKFFTKRFKILRRHYPILVEKVFSYLREIQIDPSKGSGLPEKLSPARRDIFYIICIFKLPLALIAEFK
jgi:Txe/YoeB family toxin of Txe-Axe toxin-antitoxin module